MSFAGGIYCTLSDRKMPMGYKTPAMIVRVVKNRVYLRVRFCAVWVLVGNWSAGRMSKDSKRGREERHREERTKP